MADTAFKQGSDYQVILKAAKRMALRMNVEILIDPKKATEFTDAHRQNSALVARQGAVRKKLQLQD